MKKKWILSHYDLGLWPEVINFNMVRSSAISSRLAKTASKLVHQFGWNIVHKQSPTDTHTQTNYSENITPLFSFCIKQKLGTSSWVGLFILPNTTNKKSTFCCHTTTILTIGNACEVCFCRCWGLFVCFFYFLIPFLLLSL